MGYVPMSVAYHRMRSDRLRATVFPEAGFLREVPVAKRALSVAPARVAAAPRVGRKGDRDGAVLRAPERIWLFMLGGTSALPLMNFTVTGFSIVCIAIGLAYLLPGPRRRTATPLVLAVVGTGAYLASAWVNETSYLSPDVFAFGSFALYFCGITVLASDVERIATVLLGIAFGSVFLYVMIGTFLTSAGSVIDLWKYGVAPSATIAVLYLMATCRMRTSAVVAALLSLAALSLVLNFRSHAVICCAVALLLLLSKYRRGALSLGSRVVSLGAFAVGFTWAACFEVKFFWRLCWRQSSWPVLWWLACDTTRRAPNKDCPTHPLRRSFRRPTVGRLRFLSATLTYQEPVQAISVIGGQRSSRSTNCGPSRTSASVPLVTRWRHRSAAPNVAAASRRWPVMR